MNHARRNGLLVAAIHLGLVGAVGGKFALDRASHPRVWVQTVPVDPDLPIRGRYVRLNVAVEHPEPELTKGLTHGMRLEVQGEQLVALESPAGRHYIHWQPCGPERNCWVLQRALAFFIPEHIPDPSRLAPGEELWVEVTVPPTGPPRPIRLGVKKDGGLQLLRN
jgi:hypothetical protein